MFGRRVNPGSDWSDWPWGGFDAGWAAFDDLRRRMERLFEGTEPAATFRAAAGPRATLADEGGQFVLRAELPGLQREQLHLTLTGDVLTVAGERKAEALEGYSVHRQERMPFRFARSYTLPCKVDAEKTTAELKNGVLTVTIAKAPEAQPRQIALKS